MKTVFLYQQDGGLPQDLRQQTRPSIEYKGLCLGFTAEP